MYLGDINEIINKVMCRALDRCNKLGHKNKKYRKRVANRNRLKGKK